MTRRACLAVHFAVPYCMAYLLHLTLTFIYVRIFVIVVQPFLAVNGGDSGGVARAGSGKIIS